MMALMPILHSGAGSNAVQLPSVLSPQFLRQTPCTHGIRLDSDGGIYEKQGNGNWSKVGQWLLFGSASSFNVSRTIDSGSLTTDAGAGPLALSSDRSYDISNAAWDTTKETVITLTIDAGAGDLAETQYVLSASLAGDLGWEEDIYRPTWAPPSSYDRD